MFMPPAAGAASGRAPIGRRRCRCWRAACICCTPATATGRSSRLMVPAEQLARFGVAGVARAGARPCRGRRAAAGRPGGRARCSAATACRCARAQPLVQPDLAATLAQLRVVGRRRPVPGRAGAPAGRQPVAAGRRPTDAGRPARRAADAGPGADRAAGTATRWPSCRRRPMAAWPRRRRSRRCSSNPTDLAAPQARALAVAARWRQGGVHRRRAADATDAAAGGAAAAAGLHHLRHAGSRRQCRGLRADHGQPVRHRPDRAGTWASCWPPRRPACRRRCSPRRWPGTSRRSTRSAPRSAAPARPARRWRSPWRCCNTLRTGAADGRAGARPGPRQRDRLRQLSAGR